MTPQQQAGLVSKGIAHQNARRFKEAEYAYQSVLRENPRNADALNLMGTLAVEANRLDIAREYFTKALALRPKEPVYLNNLANALLTLGEADAALPLFRKAVRQHPRYAEAMCNIGRTYRVLSKPDKARPYFEEALSIDPDFVRARAGLAELDVEVGNMETAAARFRDILAHDPCNVQALCGIATTMRFAETDPELDLIEARLADPGETGEHRVLLHHAAGKICNDLGRFDDAIAHFIHAKELAKSPFHMELHHKTYCELKGLFTAEFFAARRSYGDPSERPVFIVGMPRSGTTLTEQIIASHPRAHGAGELPDIRKIGAALEFGTPDPSRFARAVRDIRPSGVAALARQYLNVLTGGAGEAPRVTDKNPHNYEHLGLIAMMFPNARVVHCIRDALDTCVSCFMHPFADGHAYNTDLATLGRYYVEYAGLMDHWRRVLPLEMLELRYEDMIADQEARSRDLIAFLDLDWHDDCLSFFATERSVRTPSRWQVRQPIYDTSIGRWKRYEAHLGPLRQALGDLAGP